MTIFPLPEWLPDLPAHQNPGLITCRNVIPKTAASYGPFSSLSIYSDALSGRCQGAFTARDNAGNVNLFAGDATKLKRLTSASPSWSDVSRIAGGAYSTSADDTWRFVQYGSRVIATNFADNPQSYVIGADTAFSDLAGAPPKGRYVAIWKDFVVFGHLQSFPQRVRWSAINDPTSWPAIGTTAAAEAQADQQDLVGDGGWVQGLIGGLGQADGVVFQERAIWRATYVGPPLIFSFDLIEGARGTPVPGSLVQLGGLAAYLGEDGFYLFDGASSVPIGGDKVDKFFFADFDQTYSSRMSSTVDPINKVFYWAYPGSGNTGGVPNRIIAYNWALKRWSLIETGAEFIFRAGTFGYNVDNADALGYDADRSPFGPDSRFWAGGKSILAGFDGDHRLGFFSGPALGASLETGDLDLGEGRRALVTGVRPIADTPAITVSVGARNDQAAPVAYSVATSPTDDGFCPQRVATRYPRARIDIAAGAAWSHASGFEPRIRPEGRR